MYEEFYGLHERPFELTPNPRFLFLTSSHREALSAIQYGIAGRKGLTLVVGPAGTGKTTLVHAAIAAQDGQHTTPLYLPNAQISREELFQFLSDELDMAGATVTSRPKFLSELRHTLVARLAGGAVTALIVDEAQGLSDELLEEVRLLENLETTNEKLLPLVLVGQIELAERLRQPHLEALKQRIALRSTLAPLDAAETLSYVTERIRIAGGDIQTVFTADAIDAVCESCGGIPRTISVVCDNALVTGFALDQRPVGATVVEEVCRDFDLPSLAAGRSTDRFTATGAPNGPSAVPANEPFVLARQLEGTRPPGPPAEGRARMSVAPQTRPILARTFTMSNIVAASGIPPEALVTEPAPSEPPPRATDLPSRMRAVRSFLLRTAAR